MEKNKTKNGAEVERVFFNQAMPSIIKEDNVREALQSATNHYSSLNLLFSPFHIYSCEPLHKSWICMRFVCHAGKYAYITTWAQQQFKCSKNTTMIHPFAQCENVKIMWLNMSRYKHRAILEVLMMWYPISVRMISRLLELWKWDFNGDADKQ